MDYNRDAFVGSTAPQSRGSPPSHVARPLLVNSVFGNTPVVAAGVTPPRQRPLVRRKLKLNDKSPEKHDHLQEQQQQHIRKPDHVSKAIITPAKLLHDASNNTASSSMSATPLAHLSAELLRHSRSIDASPQLKDAVNKLQHLVSACSTRPG